jgi:hypothetical protein
MLMFLALSMDNVSIELVPWGLSKVTIQFTLFSGSRRESERGEWGEEGYCIMGQAQVPPRHHKLSYG